MKKNIMVLLLLSMGLAMGCSSKDAQKDDKDNKGGKDYPYPDDSKKSGSSY